MTDVARGLLVDFGGVLTTSFTGSMRAFERTEGLPEGVVFEILTAAYFDEAAAHPVARLELGQLSVDEFEHAFIAELRARGHELAPERLHARMLAQLREEPAMWAVVRRAKDAGVRTGMLSNSWGDMGYPRELMAAHFDDVVLSGDVGLRKPDPAIFTLACERLGLAPEACAFVDDVQWNVDAAVALGMFGVRHRDAEATAAELEEFLGVSLRAA